MAQIFNSLVSGVTTMGELYSTINNNFATVSSNNSGVSFPANPTNGTLFFKTDESRLYIYDNAWRDLSEVCPDIVAALAEIVAARGETASLAARLDVAINKDGTLKTNAPAGQWWESTGEIPIYVDDAQFELPGDYSALFYVDQAVRVTNGSGPHYSYVTSASYNDIDEKTYVTIEDAIVSGIVEVEFGQATPNSPKRFTESESDALMDSKIEAFKPFVREFADLKFSDKDVSIYVETTGSDETGDGSEVKPYATLTYALEKARQITLPPNTILQIKVGDGEFHSDHAYFGCQGSMPSSVYISGNGSDKTKLLDGILCTGTCVVTIGGMTIEPPANIGVKAMYGAMIYIDADVVVNTPDTYAVFATYNSGIMSNNAALTINSCKYGLAAEESGHVTCRGVVVLECKEAAVSVNQGGVAHTQDLDASAVTTTKQFIRNSSGGHINCQDAILGSCTGIALSLNQGSTTYANGTTCVSAGQYFISINNARVSANGSTISYCQRGVHASVGATVDCANSDITATHYGVYAQYQAAQVYARNCTFRASGSALSPIYSRSGSVVHTGGTHTVIGSWGADSPVYETWQANGSHV